MGPWVPSLAQCRLDANTLIPALRKWEQENQESKVFFVLYREFKTSLG